jgi:hypothetical protein
MSSREFNGLKIGWLHHLNRDKDATPKLSAVDIKVAL